ncbi:MAG: GTPase ObgE [Clostridiales bacterium]|nr:GTPase ObgE [Clostridiales bacterium]
MFIDKAAINVKSGKGGDGCVSFYRAKYIVSGGPDGGDGGRGGDVIFEASDGMVTLMDFRYKRKFAARDGENGQKCNRSGKSGEDVTIKTPVGTIIRETKSGKIMADMTTPGERITLLKGGRGGRGNQRFATPTRQAPRYAEPGKPSKSYDITLELKLIADVGVIGFPNVGKSTLLSMATNANPKIANYHFTTLSPNLGVVRDAYGEDFVLADIPGLIEGAGTGAGLGYDFLRHIERTRALIHVVDASGMEGTDPVESVYKINAELKSYNEKLTELPQVIAANKMDLCETRENFERLKDEFEKQGIDVFAISAASNDGITPLISHMARVLKDNPDRVAFHASFDFFEEPPDDEEPVIVEKTGERNFSVRGSTVEKMLGRTNLDTEKGFAFFQKFLKDVGITRQLDELGVKDGDTVSVCGFEFENWS